MTVYKLGNATAGHLVGVDSFQSGHTSSCGQLSDTGEEFLTRGEPEIPARLLMDVLVGFANALPDLQSAQDPAVSVHSPRCLRPGLIFQPNQR